MANTQRLILPSFDTSSVTPSCRKTWTDYLSTYTSKYEEEIGKYKELLRKATMESMEEKPIREQMSLVDSIQRLGLGYHFKQEIEAVLSRLYYDPQLLFHRKDMCLYHASLLFRLFRQHGYNIPCGDVFKQFLGEDGKLKESMSEDIDGMLSLYEASYLRSHEDKILDKVFYFTKAQLKAIMEKSDDEKLVNKIGHALEYPIHKIVARLDTRFYISQYENNPFHCKTLLDFAKLDFNLLQELHKEELEYLARWCNVWDVPSKISFKVRDHIIVAIYFCALGAMDEHPQRSVVRIIWFKLCWLCTIIDDIYDLVDIPQLQLLTSAIQRWDKKRENQLPSTAQFAYTLMVEVFEDVKHDMAEIGRVNFLDYIVDAWKRFFWSHLITSKWCREEYIPSLDEYLSEAAMSIGIIFPTFSFALEENATPQMLEWAMKYPKAIEAFGKITRIEDDIADDDQMQETATEKPSAVACYMKQYKMSNKKQVYEDLQKISNEYWKDINQAMLGSTVVPKFILECILKQARYLCLLRPEGDGYTNPHTTFMKKNYDLLFKDSA